MDHKNLSPVPTSTDSEHKYLRVLIKLYNQETDPTRKQELMEKLLAAKAKMDYEKMVIDCA